MELAFRTGAHQQTAVAVAQKGPDVLRLRIEHDLDFPVRALAVDLAVRRRPGVDDTVAVDPDREDLRFLGGEELRDGTGVGTGGYLQHLARVAGAGGEATVRAGEGEQEGLGEGGELLRALRQSQNAQAIDADVDEFAGKERGLTVGPPDLDFGGGGGPGAAEQQACRRGESRGGTASAPHGAVPGRIWRSIRNRPSSGVPRSRPCSLTIARFRARGSPCSGDACQIERTVAGRSGIGRPSTISPRAGTTPSAASRLWDLKDRSRSQLVLERGGPGWLKLKPGGVDADAVAHEQVVTAGATVLGHHHVQRLLETVAAMPAQIEDDLDRIARADTAGRCLSPLDRDRARRVALSQGQVDALDLHRLVVRVHQGAHQRDQVEGGARAGVRTVEDLAQRHVGVASQPQRAGHVEAALAAAVRGRVERLHRRDADQRRQHDGQVGEPEIETAGLAVRRLDVDRHRDRPGLGAERAPEPGEAILVEGADHGSDVAEPGRAVEPGNDADHLDRRHRHAQGSHAEIGVAHGQHFAVLDPGHRAADGELQVTVDQDARDRAARAELGCVGRLGAPGGSGGEHPADRLAEAQRGDRGAAAAPVGRRQQSPELLRHDFADRLGHVLRRFEKLPHRALERRGRAGSGQTE